MEQRFPGTLEEKLLALLRPLERFGVETRFLVRVADLNREDVIRPDYDDADWAALDPRTLARDQGVTWIRARLTVPERCADIPVEGSQLRIMAENGNAYFAPLEIYADGRLLLKERSWMDFKSPEGIIAESAEPGRVHTIAMRFDLNEKCYWLNDVTLRLVSDRVEDTARHVRSIIEELKYMERFEGTEPLLDEAYAMLDAAARTGLLMKVREAEERARALFEGYREQVKRSRVSLVGHAHIDMNWFWSMEETRGIVKRDFTTMTNLMEKYPDFTFSQSQCATYEIAREDCPEVFEKIRRRAQEGRWDVTASTWVEGDLNMAQGEAIVRHVLYSKEYLKQHFDRMPRIMWCPDTFGHPGTLPQILKKTGLDRYYHTRCGLGVGSHEDDGFAFLTDSRHTPVYWWKGLDGSRVLVCNTVYSREIDTRGILRASARMHEFGVDNAMLTYGVGDHGGGPTERDIRWVQTMRTFPTTPDIEFSTTERYYGEIEQGNYDLPERNGEMNFVFDGCYTTHADIKRQNRLCEEGLMAVEKLYAIAGQFGVAYPYDELRACWKKTLFNQFHDILDGSGVKDTYRFTHEEAKAVLDTIDALTRAAMTALAEHFGVPGRKSFLVYNPTGFDRCETVELPVEAGRHYAAEDAQGNRLRCQVDGATAKVFVKMPASGLTTVALIEAEERGAGRIVDDGQYYRVATPLYEVEICKANGQITTLYDIRRDWYVVRREDIGWRLKKGVLNSLQIHMEEPTAMSGWTIGNVRTVHNLLDGAQSEIICDGDAESRIRFTHHFMNSTICQDIVIRPEEPEIRFENRVDWQEYGDFDRDAPMLRVYFAPDIRHPGRATYEIPFGTLERDCTDNEYPALNWVDLSDGEHGFAVLNDCKHGYKCRGNAVELSLIRSGWLPDQRSDVGEHVFTYAILPHDGDWREGKVIAAGQAMNQRPAAAAASGAKSGMQLVRVDGAVLSNVKCAEAGDGLVLRLYQPGSETTQATVQLPMPIASVQELDLLERPIGEADVRGDGIHLVMSPYEIRTLFIATARAEPAVNCYRA